MMAAETPPVVPMGALCLNEASALENENEMCEEEEPGVAVAKSLESLGAKVFYEKVLTSSDANGSGRVVIPKAIAEQYFPPLESQAGVSIDASDSLGNSYVFRFRFWINNQSRMYLLEGVGELHQRYALKVGDVMIFAHLPENSLVVSGRPMTQADMLRKTSIKRANVGASGVKRDTSHRRLPKFQPARKTRKLSRLSKQGQESSSHDQNGFHPPPGDEYNNQDGVFRAIPCSSMTMVSNVFPQNGVWTAVIEIIGEMYQAFFDTQLDALEAFNAAGFGCEDRSLGDFGTILAT